MKHFLMSFLLMVTEERRCKECNQDYEDHCLDCGQCFPEETDHSECRGLI